MFSRITKFIKEYKELKYLAFHDSLTGCLNRNWLYKNIQSIKYRYVYFVDINNMHEVNKSGHIVGDKHICDIANALKNKEDILIRYAGDEFVLFSNTNNRLVENDLYSFGIAEIGADSYISIELADKRMIESKYSKK